MKNNKILLVIGILILFIILTIDNKKEYSTGPYDIPRLPDYKPSLEKEFKKTYAGEFIEEYNLPISGEINGMAFKDDKWYMSNISERTIYQLDTNFNIIGKWDLTSELVKATEWFWPKALVWKKEELWMSAFNGGAEARVYKLNWTNKQVLQYRDISGMRWPEGIIYDNLRIVLGAYLNPTIKLLSSEIVAFDTKAFETGPALKQFNLGGMAFNPDENVIYFLNGFRNYEYTICVLDLNYQEPLQNSLKYCFGLGTINDQGDYTSIAYKDGKIYHAINGKPSKLRVYKANPYTSFIDDRNNFIIGQSDFNELISDLNRWVNITKEITR